MAFLTRNWRWLLPSLVALFLGWQLSSTRNALERERAEHDLFAARVEAKAHSIRAAFLEYKARVEANQIRVSQEVSREYQERLAALRLEYERRLREQSTPGSGSGPGGPAPSVPGTPGAPGRPHGPAAPVDEWACRANSLQLEFLQRWVREALSAPRDPQ